MARTIRSTCLFWSAVVFAVASLIAPAFAGRLAGEDPQTLIERRLSPEVLVDLVAGVRSGDTHRTVQVIVQFENNPRMANTDREIRRLERELLVESMGGRAVKHLPIIDAVAIEVPLERLIDLAHQQGVVRISSDAIVKVNGDSDPSLTVQTTGADQAQSVLGVTGKGVAVVVIDSGVDTRFGLRIKAAEDFTGADPEDRNKDKYGHGTHVAGIIAANLKGSSAGFSGMAPDAELIALKAIGDDGSGRTSDVIDAFNWCIRNQKQYGIRIINLSAGAPP